MESFKARCSSIGQLMTGSIGLTAKQFEEFGKLAGKEKRTKLQEERLKDLMHKNDNPELPKTVTSLLDTWIKEQLYNRRKTISNKYVEKGVRVEDDAITFISDYFGKFYLKNEKYYSGEYLTGTPDIVTDEIIDVKCSYDVFTFPLFEEKLNSLYFWQVQGYMELTGLSKAKVIYCLMDTPDDLIYKDARSMAYSCGNLDATDDFYAMLCETMKYDDIEDDIRIKVFEVERCERSIQNIKDRVKIARKYIEERVNNFEINLLMKSV